MIGGAMYADLRLIGLEACIVLPDGATAEQGASLFVNPLTALGLRRDDAGRGHSAVSIARRVEPGPDAGAHLQG